MSAAESMVDDILLNKVAIIERCLARLEQEYRGHENELETDLTRQDSIILNLQRCCEAAIASGEFSTVIPATLRSMCERLSD